jgi:diguanylate cyclase (GGDEF)-like protein/PAS domain S-box-containing protein
MKKLLPFLIVYLIIIASISSVSYRTIDVNQKRLHFTSSELEGVKYLKNLYKLSIAISEYMEYKVMDTSRSILIGSQTNIKHYIDTLYYQQSKNPLFINETLNKQLALMRNFSMSDEGYVAFLEMLNHENYRIGDVAKILFENNRELYFLGTLVTHYMPEYLISLFLVHNIIKELHYQKSLSSAKKNLFIEQNKLVYLSSEEISGIIHLLGEHGEFKVLFEPINNIRRLLLELKVSIQALSNWNASNEERLHYIDATHTLLKLSFELNVNQFNILELRLNQRKERLLQEMVQVRVVVVFLILLIAVLMVLFYKSNRLNINKDMEINRISKTLDDLVVFSKTDAKGIITYSSSALERLSGFSHEELIGKNHRLFRHPDMDNSIFTELWDTILAKQTWSGELLNKARDGSSYWVKVTIVPGLNKKGEIVDFTAYRIDITAQKSLETLAVLDTLTQLFNRLKIDQVLQIQYDRYQRYKEIFSIIIIDIDLFKEVNDTYGHLVGDDILKRMAILIKENARVVDIVGRWGGEEFMVICENTNGKGAYDLSEKIRLVVEAYHFKEVGTKTISVGVASMEKGLEIKGLIKRADDALYEAKESGRNRVVLANKA